MKSWEFKAAETDGDNIIHANHIPALLLQSSSVGEVDEIHHLTDRVALVWLVQRVAEVFKRGEGGKLQW